MMCKIIISNDVSSRIRNRIKENIKSTEEIELLRKKLRRIKSKINSLNSDLLIKQYKKKFYRNDKINLSPKIKFGFILRKEIDETIYDDFFLKFEKKIKEYTNTGLFNLIYIDIAETINDKLKKNTKNTKILRTSNQFNHYLEPPISNNQFLLKFSSDDLFKIEEEKK